MYETMKHVEIKWKSRRVNKIEHRITETRPPVQDTWYRTGALWIWVLFMGVRSIIGRVASASSSSGIGESNGGESSSRPLAGTEGTEGPRWVKVTAGSSSVSIANLDSGVGSSRDVNRNRREKIFNSHLIQMESVPKIVRTIQNFHDPFIAPTHDETIARSTVWGEEESIICLIEIQRKS